jgi:hypothetical protein
MLAQLTGGRAPSDNTRLAAQSVSASMYGTRSSPGANAEPAPQGSSTYGPYSGGSYNISDDIGPIQPGEADQSMAPAYGGNTNWGSATDAAPAPVSGIEPLPPIE